MTEKLGIALGSGGARGLCQIGILLWLQEHEIRPDFISGCSIGSVIGGHTAAGYSPGYLKKTALDINWLDLVKWLQLSFRGTSIFTWDKILEFLTQTLGGRNIEELEIPFACVTTDINTGQEHVFDSGDLLKAVSASSAIAGIFPPVPWEEKLFVDGELVNPVPLDIAFRLGADKVIGVNCNRPVQRKMARQEDSPSLVEKMEEWVKQSAEKGPEQVSRIYDKMSDSLQKISGDKRDRMFYEIISDSYAVLSSQILQYKRSETGPHLMIEPEVGKYGVFDFEKAETLIEAGYNEMESREHDLLEFLKQ